MRILTLPTWISLAIFASLLIVPAAKTQEASPRDDRRTDAGNRKGHSWDSLSEEERRKLREALREVWTDPAVISAREEVSQASNAYHEAIEAAVAAEDPAVAKLLNRVQAARKGRLHDRIGEDSLTKHGRRRGDYPMGSPGFLEKLSPEEQEKFRSAQEAARESEAVREAREELEALREEDKDLRHRRLAAYKRMREAMHEAMVAADPEIEELRERFASPRVKPE